MRTKTLLGFLIPFSLAFATSSFASDSMPVKAETNQISQNKKTIKGKVTDSQGEPMVGVTIFLKNDPGKGTITDIDGKYSIDVPEGAELVFSSIGYVKQTLKVRAGALDVVMKEDTQALDEVVVVGYGTTTKRSMIASVSSVKSEELATLPITNMSKGLAGRAPGLIVKTSGGGINNKAQISIRGGSTPLVVIDGVIRNYDDFIQMPSEDIESLSLLKDASATAVYGSRAADGIIQVTTKKGKEGKAYIEYNFNMSLAEPAYWKQRLDSWDRAEYANKAKQNDGLPDAFSADRIQKMRDGSDPLQNNNTNYRDLALNHFAPQSTHSIRMTGGTEVNNYYMSLSHLDQESLYKSNNHNMQRTNFRLSQSSLIKAIGLKTTATLDGYLQKQTHPYSWGASEPYHIFGHIQNASPLLPGVNKLGLPYYFPNNPVMELAKDNGYIRKEEKMINGNLKLEWAVPWVEGLNLSATGNYRYGFNAIKQWRKDGAGYAWD